MESDDPFGQSPGSQRTLRSPPRGAEEPAPPVEAAPAETQEDVAGVSVDEAIGQEGAGAAVPDAAGPVTEVPDDGGPVTAQELMQMIAESGDTIPPSDINEFAGYVSELTGQKIPATLKARRAAIANWYAEQAPPIAAHTPPDSARRRAAAALAQNPDAAFERPPMPPDRETVLRNIAQHGAQVRRCHAATLPWPAPWLRARPRQMLPACTPRTRRTPCMLCRYRRRSSRRSRAPLRHSKGRRRPRSLTSGARSSKTGSLPTAATKPPPPPPPPLPRQTAAAEAAAELPGAAAERVQGRAWALPSAARAEEPAAEAAGAEVRVRVR